MAEYNLGVSFCPGYTHVATQSPLCLAYSTAAWVTVALSAGTSIPSSPASFARSTRRRVILETEAEREAEEEEEEEEGEEELEEEEEEKQEGRGRGGIRKPSSSTWNSGMSSFTSRINSREKPINTTASAFVS